MSGTAGRPPRDGDPGAGAWRGPGTWPEPAEWRGSWYLPEDTRRAAFPWAGIALVLLGAAFLVHQLVPRLDIAAVAAAGLGVAFLASWRLRHSRLALWPGAVLLGYGVAGILVGFGLLVGDGWTTIGAGAGIALGWLLSGIRGRPGTWLLALAALLALIGAAQVISELPALQDVERYFAPAIIIAVGLLLIGANAARRRTG